MHLFYTNKLNIKFSRHVRDHPHKNRDREQVRKVIKHQTEDTREISRKHVIFEIHFRNGLKID